jgi:hypothetical protein
MKGALPTFKGTQKGPSHKRQITYPLPKPQNWSAKAYNLFILKVPQWGYIQEEKQNQQLPFWLGIIQEDGGLG